jgi:hypothetical protein
MSICTIQKKPTGDLIAVDDKNTELEKEKSENGRDAFIFGQTKRRREKEKVRSHSTMELINSFFF